MQTLTEIITTSLTRISDCGGSWDELKINEFQKCDFTEMKISKHVGKKLPEQRRQANFWQNYDRKAYSYAWISWEAQQLPGITINFLYEIINIHQKCQNCREWQALVMGKITYISGNFTLLFFSISTEIMKFQISSSLYKALYI